MRTLVLMRGAPASGKSTFIKDNNLEEYTLSADKIRVMYSSRSLNPDGVYEISQANDRQVWDLLFNVLESRMQRGEFTVIDACNSKSKEMSRYKKLASKYRYRIFLVDLTDVPLQECQQRNIRRGYKAVPSHVIENIYSRFENQKVPSGIKVIKPENFFEEVCWKEWDLNEYDAVNVIGDIHGCYTALSELIERMGGIKDNEYYIFVGDYLDRGIENAEVMKWILAHYQRKNILFLEGNHEHHLRCYAKGDPIVSKVFARDTIPALEKAGIKPEDVRPFVDRLCQCVEFDYRMEYADEFTIKKLSANNDDRSYKIENVNVNTNVVGAHILCTHGGLPVLRLDKNVDNIVFLAAKDLIHGVGKYEDVSSVANSFSDLSLSDPNDLMLNYQCFGHRNVDNLPIKYCNNNFILENDVEYGGTIRGVKFTHNKAPQCFEVINTVYKIVDTGQNKTTDNPIYDMCHAMRESNYIHETEIGNISSFVFTPEAFRKKRWGDVVNKARGFFVNTNDYTIAARSYDKFFYMDEVEETKEANLKSNLQFPVTGYLKENGFLGIVGYNSDADEMIISSKSTFKGTFADMFRAILETKIGTDGLNKMKEIVKTENVSFIFEVIDPVNDPHIIEYNDAHVVLLDIVERTLEFKKKNYDDVVKYAAIIGVPCKQKEVVLNSFDELKDFMDTINKDTGFNNKIEGYVFEDTNGFMFKFKTPYYNVWKRMRSFANAVFRDGHSRYTGGLLTPIDNKIYKFLQDVYHNTTSEQRSQYLSNNHAGYDIIKIRKMFESGDCTLPEAEYVPFNFCDEVSCPQGTCRPHSKKLGGYLCCCHCDRRDKCNDEFICDLYKDNKDKMNSDKDNSDICRHCHYMSWGEYRKLNRIRGPKI